MFLLVLSSPGKLVGCALAAAAIWVPEPFERLRRRVTGRSAAPVGWPQ